MSELCLCKPKLVYLAHPVGGNIQENVKDVLSILREIHTRSMSMDNCMVLPFAPYMTCLQYLDDNVSKERELGILLDKEFFVRGIMDEVWFSGSKFSKGMIAEVGLCVKYSIPMKCYERDKFLQPELDSLVEKFSKELGDPVKVSLF